MLKCGDVSRKIRKISKIGKMYRGLNFCRSALKYKEQPQYGCILTEFVMPHRSTAPLSSIESVHPQHALIYLMVMVSAADGDMTDAEMATMGDMVKHLPVFKAFPLEDLIDVARGLPHHLGAADGMMQTLHLIKRSLPVRLYETAYAIACDIAASDGGLSHEELRVLELIRHEMDIDRLHAAAIERGAKARYLIA